MQLCSASDRAMHNFLGHFNEVVSPSLLFFYLAVKLLIVLVIVGLVTVISQL